MDIPFLSPHIKFNKLYCKMCINTELFLFDKDEQIYKCKTCGSLFKYNEPQKTSKLTIDPELDNTGKSTIIFVETKKTTDQQNELGEGYRLVKEYER